LNTITPINARKELEDILSEREYQKYYRQEKNTLAELLEQFQEWINRHLSKILPNVEVRENTSEWISYGMVGLGIAIVLLLLVMFSSRIVRENRFYSKPIGTEADLIMSPSSHLTQALKHNEEGDIRLALRHLFLAYLLQLDQNKWVEAKAWKTNGEYYDELRTKQPERSKSFRNLAQQFEATWYGGKDISKEEFAIYHQQVVKLMDTESVDDQMAGEPL
jgi:hypothetical protein